MRTLRQWENFAFLRYHLKGVCKNADSCAFAHGLTELQSRPDLSKTSWCREFLSTGTCVNMANCRFCHSQNEFRDTIGYSQRRLCKFFPKGLCQHAERCRFQHETDPIECMEASTSGGFGAGGGIYGGINGSSFGGGGYRGLQEEGEGVDPRDIRELGIADLIRDSPTEKDRNNWNLE